MNYNEFLTRVIDEGIAAATADYTNESDKDQLEGSIAGFNACRDKSPEQLVELWTKAGMDVNNAFGDMEKRYWFFRCYQLEVEWVINVVSAMLMNEGYKPLLAWLPTANGGMKAASILGTQSRLL
jgi:hypothetical protein